METEQFDYPALCKAVAIIELRRWRMIDDLNREARDVLCDTSLPLREVDAQLQEIDKALTILEAADADSTH